mmetsp:Transcript_8615/g.24763  ORF Transcript_8615/g.24763 Transcript_8615/m.24763 type:complete len:275 (+) Transcript_8615:251-1075(+)
MLAAMATMKLPSVWLKSCQTGVFGANTALRHFATGASRQDGMLPRLYKEVMVREDPEGWTLMLDSRVLNTPGKNVLTVPSKSLAMAVATEWEYQDTRSIRPFTMPLMTLASMAIDQPKPKPATIETMMRYLKTDSLCLREEGHHGLSAVQEQLYSPIMNFYEQDFKLDLLTTTAIFGLEQPEPTVAKLKSYLESLDPWHLTAVEALSSASRSILIGVALSHGVLPPAEALRVARLEENYQMEEWGFVEGGHDIDNADFAVQVSAPLVFLHLLKD